MLLLASRFTSKETDKHISMDTLTKIRETLDCGILDVIELVQDGRIRATKTAGERSCRYGKHHFDTAAFFYFLRRKLMPKFL